MRASLTLLILCLGLGFGAIGQAQLTPRARMVVRGQLDAAAIGAPGAQRGAGALVTVRLKGGADRLRALGLPALPITADIASVELTRDALAFLAGLAPNEAMVIEERRLFRPLLDRAATMIGAPATRAATGLTGRGVLVGIVDTGIDLRHADLRTASGDTRVVALLDLSTPTDSRHQLLGEYGGAVWLRDEIDATLTAEAAGTTAMVPVSERDVEGHGTHVAAIAASNGLATGLGFPTGRYVGIAPDAELVVARASTTNGGISDVGVLSACRFVIDRANELSRPLVVNLSLGAASGPHDGSTNLELAFDQLFPRDQPGRAVIVAAGNDGGRDLHAGGWALDGELTLPIVLRDGGTGAFAVDLWYRGQLEIAVETPNGRRSSFVALGGTNDTSFDGEARVIVDNAGEELQRGQHQAGFLLSGIDAARPVSGTYTLHLRGRSIRYDAWINDAALGGFGRFVDRVVADDRLTVPATAHSVISVGSLVSRLDWNTVDGRMFVPGNADPTRTGGPSFFSAPGPTADGRFGPDVSAPGEYVVAAMSIDATPDHPSSVFRGDERDLTALVAEDGVHGVLRGTSQATPIATGAVAILLQAAPTLTSETIREILRTTAAPVEGTAGWSPRAGFGRVDLPAALAYLHGERGAAVDAARSIVGVSRDLLPPDSEESTLVTVTPRDASGKALGGGHAVTIELSAGAPLGAVSDRAGRYERSFVAHAPRGATGIVRVTVDGVPLAAQPRVFFVPSRAEVGGDLTPGAGCAFGRGVPGVTAALLFVLAVLIASRLRLVGRRRS